MLSDRWSVLRRSNGTFDTYNDVVVHRPGGLGSGADGDVLLLGELEKIGTSLESVEERGDAPGGQNLHLGVTCLPRQLEADLARRRKLVRCKSDIG